MLVPSMRYLLLLFIACSGDSAQEVVTEGGGSIFANQ